ncbi:hypothetical protein C5L38_35490 (plasmid) [Streptomyces sp. WAC00288]|uniref:hypothetical protein n=1 Tax=unclassified Streptomyces TaxID=2593676 RepID=UPI0007894B01|nr:MULTISPECIES: hypothetical protein [unclassified Streptomyces]AVI00039.1 hypothetical protein C5L38_33705 [Streptomyces sp. WAC00288]AVI00177.1 hypothetical protein C5L38_34505 [Streptomyces sp. WAC00288]AVI00340.1 hypothetical protein C5L38_35490 [Streptomyces sp. WAC00288]KYG51103.1 hypothetical protein AWI43_32130 [Streptomyces sp. WAC04657]
MAKTDPEDLEQRRREAEELLLAKYGGGRSWLDPVRVMHAVRAAADHYGPGDGEQVEVPAADVLAALTQLDEARAALDTLERDLTRAARRRGASWQQIADHLGLASRSSAESRAVRLERDAATYRGDRYPEKQRAARARDRSGDAWCRANEARLRAATRSLARLGDRWEQLARTASAEQLGTWHRDLDGPALAARLRSLRLVLGSDGAELPGGDAAAARDEVLALLDELIAARHGGKDVSTGQ